MNNAEDFIHVEPNDNCVGGYGIRVYAPDGRSAMVFGGKAIECHRMVATICSALSEWPDWQFSDADVAQAWPLRDNS